MSGAFIAGEGDYVTLFEPVATALEKDNKAYIVASIGENLVRFHIQLIVLQTHI